MGGSIAMSYCEQFGVGELAGVVLVDISPCCLPKPDWPQANTPFDQEGIARWKRAWPHERRAVIAEAHSRAFNAPAGHTAEIEQLIEDGLDADPSVALEVLLDGLGCDFRRTLSSISVPVLVMNGLFSSSTGIGVREFMADAIPQATSLTFEDSGHAIMFEEPARFNDALHTFSAMLSAGIRA
jgi:pimeloyl-ACP methyl ester carboxylesterase